MWKNKEKLSLNIYPYSVRKFLDPTKMRKLFKSNCKYCVDN